MIPCWITNHSLVGSNVHGSIPCPSPTGGVGMGTAATRIRGTLVWFARMMEGVLRDNDNRQHWTLCSPSFLADKLAEEYKEVVQMVEEHGINKLCSTESAPVVREHFILECVDLANLAMMLADRARKPSAMV